MSGSCVQILEAQDTFDVCRTLSWWIECYFSCEIYFWENVRQEALWLEHNVSLESQLLLWLSFTIVKKKNGELILNKNITNDGQALRADTRFCHILAVVSPRL